jgi:hypothetical protein
MKISITRLAFAAVVAVAIAAAFFRITTAEDRVSERRALARTVCASTGGVWMSINGTEVCDKGDLAKKD